MVSGKLICFYLLLHTNRFKHWTGEIKNLNYFYPSISLPFPQERKKKKEEVQRSGYRLSHWKNRWCLLCLSLLMLPLQWHWNHLYIKEGHRKSADLISVTWFVEGMVWLTVMVISYLIGFKRSLKNPQTNRKSNPTPTNKALHQAFLV